MYFIDKNNLLNDLLILFYIFIQTQIINFKTFNHENNETNLLICFCYVIHYIMF